MAGPKITASDIERIARECDEAGIAITLTLPVSWPRPPGFPPGDAIHASGHGVCYMYDPAVLLQWIESLQRSNKAA